MAILIIAWLLCGAAIALWLLVGDWRRGIDITADALIAYLLTTLMGPALFLALCMGEILSSFQERLGRIVIVKGRRQGRRFSEARGHEG